MVTLRLPFSQLNDRQLPFALSQGRNPDRPDPNPAVLIDGLWQLCVLRWNDKADLRPTSRQVVVKVCRTSSVALSWRVLLTTFSLS
jgi:hypothetical protein